MPCPFFCSFSSLRVDFRRSAVGPDGQYAVITDLTEEQLNTKYPEELADYRPFIILSRAMGLAIREQQRNEEKYKKLVEIRRNEDPTFDETSKFFPLYRS